MKKSFAYACFGAFCSFGLLTASAAEGVVAADLLNVRLKPDLRAPVAVKLDRGFQVNVLGENGEFVEIAIPVTAPVYISAVYLNEDKTTAPLKMYVAGSNRAASYGVLPKGSTVKVLEIDRYGWAKIEPPAGLKLYAAKRYVQYLPGVKPEAKPEVKPEAKPEVKPEAKPEVKPEVKPEAKPAAKPAAKPEAKPAAKPEEKQPAKMSAETEAALRELRVTPAEGTPVTEKGALLKIENTTVPLLQYALMKGDTHVYYVCSDQIKLADLGDKELTFRGRSFRVPGWRVPVLYVESLTPVVE
ncbi:hypothetical protein [uncultured Victivallis sp.]|uniref:SH3 domain-containing protein n=1 Tax=uncultured Victivallis sp. TaxID=354118 RepID=UPI0025DC3DE9|nr:hypothetical protein [uncultured Victivallis sp.]